MKIAYVACTYRAKTIQGVVENIRRARALLCGFGSWVTLLYAPIATQLSLTALARTQYGWKVTLRS